MRMLTRSWHLARLTGATVLAGDVAREHAAHVSSRARSEPDGPPRFGLPEHSALTVEGRVERAGGVGTRAVRRGQAREHGVWHSNWAAGLLLILLALAAVIGVAILASLVS